MTLRLERAGAVARLLIDRPEKRNAMTGAMWAALPRLVGEAMDDPKVRVLVLASAAPGVFAAGADIHELAQGAPDPAWRAESRAAIRGAQTALARAPKPTLAQIDGDCVGGGCGLAIACDFRLASPRARLGITPARLGLAYPLHDVRLLLGLVGPAKAKRLLMTGQLVSAAEALRIGLVDEVGEDVDGAVAALGRELIEASPFSVAAIKTTVARIQAGVLDDDDESARLFDSAFAGPDFAEGIAAFKARRRPRFADPV